MKYQGGTGKGQTKERTGLGQYVLSNSYLGQLVCRDLEKCAAGNMTVKCSHVPLLLRLLPLIPLTSASTTTLLATPS